MFGGPTLIVSQAAIVALLVTIAFALLLAIFAIQLATSIRQRLVPVVLDRRKELLLRRYD